MCLIAKMLHRRMVVLSEHNAWSAGLLSMSGCNPLVVAYGMWSQLFTARHSDVVRTVSKQLGVILKGHGLDDDRIIAIGTGANIRAFRPHPREQACETVGLDPAMKYVGFIGTLTRWQGVDVLIHSARRIMDAEPCSRFVIVGDGAEMDALRELANSPEVAPFVHFRGQVQHEDIPMIINCLDVGIGPLVTETGGHVNRCPIKLREYAACGVPVVSAVGGEGAELFEKQGALLRVPPSDPNRLAHEVIKILENPALGKTMGRAARTLAERHSSWTHKAEKILQHCEALSA